MNRSDVSRNQCRVPRFNQKVPRHNYENRRVRLSPRASAGFAPLPPTRSPRRRDVSYPIRCEAAARFIVALRMVEGRHCFEVSRPLEVPSCDGLRQDIYLRDGGPGRAAAPILRVGGRGDVSKCFCPSRPNRAVANYTGGEQPRPQQREGPHGSSCQPVFFWMELPPSTTSSWPVRWGWLRAEGEERHELGGVLRPGGRPTGVAAPITSSCSEADGVRW